MYKTVYICTFRYDHDYRGNRSGEEGRVGNNNRNSHNIGHNIGHNAGLRSSHHGNVKGQQSSHRPHVKHQHNEKRGENDGTCQGGLICTLYMIFYS